MFSGALITKEKIGPESIRNLLDPECESSCEKLYGYVFEGADHDRRGLDTLSHLILKDLRICKSKIAHM